MTYQELLHTVSFNDIRPFISKYDEGDNSPAKYEQHYNMLRYLPIEHPDKVQQINISWSKWEGRETYLEAYPLEGMIWEDAMVCELLISEDVNAPLAEIAMCCLWHSSFYGFTKEEQANTAHKLLNEDGHGTEFGKKAAKIEFKREYVLANKSIRKHLIESLKYFAKEERVEYALSMEDWNYIENHRQHCNRMKRKRDYRLMRKALLLFEQDEQTFRSKSLSPR